MEARGTPGSRAVAIANRHAATAVCAHSGGAPMTEASCMTLAYAKSRVEASKAAGEYVRSHTVKGRQLLHGRRYAHTYVQSDTRCRLPYRVNSCRAPAAYPP